MLPKIILFKELKINGNLIYKWEHIKVDERGDTRIFFKPSEFGNNNGFEFCIVQYSSATNNENTTMDVYENDGFQATCLFSGQTYFDGLRHLYMGHDDTDNNNYLYYTSTTDLIEIFTKLNELVLKYCSEPT